MAEDEKNKEPVVVRHEQLESVTAVSVSIFNPLHIEMGGEARDSIGMDREAHAEPVVQEQARGGRWWRWWSRRRWWLGSVVCLIWSVVALAVCHALALRLALFDVPCRQEHLIGVMGVVASPFVVVAHGIATCTHARCGWVQQ